MKFLINKCENSSGFALFANIFNNLQGQESNIWVSTFFLALNACKPKGLSFSLSLKLLPYLMYLSSKQRLWWDRMEAQAHLSLHCLPMPGTYVIHVRTKISHAGAYI